MKHKVGERFVVKIVGVYKNLYLFGGINDGITIWLGGERDVTILQNSMLSDDVCVGQVVGAYADQDLILSTDAEGNKQYYRGTPVDEEILNALCIFKMANPPFKSNDRQEMTVTSSPSTHGRRDNYIVPQKGHAMSETIIQSKKHKSWALVRSPRQNTRMRCTTVNVALSNSMNDMEIAMPKEMLAEFIEALKAAFEAMPDED